MTSDASPSHATGDPAAGKKPVGTQIPSQGAPAGGSPDGSPDRDGRRPWYRNVKVIVPAGVLAAVVGVVAVAAGGDNGSAGPDSSASDSPAASSGEDLSYTLKFSEGGASSYGGDVMANEEFVLARVLVTNNGDSTWSMPIGEQVLIVNGQRYNAHPEASAAYAGIRGLDFDALEPGEASQFPLVFDVPYGTTAGTLEMHQSAGSPGQTIEVQF